MAQFDLNRLAIAYQWSGKNYQDLMTQIIAHNSEKIAKKIGKLSQDTISQELSKRIPKGGKKVTLPDLTDVLPKRSVFIRKGAEQGKLISLTLRNALTKNLRDILNRPEFVTARGARAGLLRQELIPQFRSAITETFQSYTRRDPSIGVPKNINTIAVTEVRAVVNQTKHEYIERLLKENSDIVIKKKWIHNGNVFGHHGYKARMSHVHAARLDPKERSEYYVLHDEKTNTSVQALYPHAPNLPLGQVISCNCEIQYIIERKSVT